ncbi:MAG: ATP-binding protein [Pseudomonadota bacterium]|nr:ATP-binding protein [Pseudomonadota bacterium]
MRSGADLGGDFRAGMGLPVVRRRASDCPYVGETEQRIACAFAEVRETGAFLLVDEADSLLLDPAGAVRGFEISQVKEMLTWMEHHPLPFACTTNLEDRLDRASLRRFVFKVRVGWLTAAQVAEAFRRFFGMEPPVGLAALDRLTPADFALVRRRCRLLGETPDVAGLCDATGGVARTRHAPGRLHPSGVTTFLPPSGRGPG